jgi:RNA polymerase sigma-70 factor (ECF subfamily)
VTIPIRKPAEISDELLLASVRSSDHAAYQQLFHRYYSQLCSFALHCVGSADLAEDIVQEVFLYVWRHREALVIRETARTYLFSATRNAATSHLRHQRVIERTKPDVVAQFDRAPITPDRVVAYAEATESLQRAISRLPERCRLVFTLQREQSMTYAEVAQTLGISVKTVDVQMGRALKALRRMLGPNWP